MFRKSNKSNVLNRVWKFTCAALGQERTANSPLQSQQLFPMIQSLQSEFIASTVSVPVHEYILFPLLEYTDSMAIAYALVENQDIVLVSHQIRNQSQAQPQREQEMAVSLDGITALMGQVASASKALIKNQLEFNSGNGGNKPEIGAIDSFMGVPLFIQGDLVAVIAMWNRSGGYSADWIAHLAPFLAVCEEIYQAHHRSVAHEAQFVASRTKEQQLNACWNNMRESMLLMDEQGVVKFANAAAYQLFDYPGEELKGAYLQQLIAAPYSEHLCQTINHLANNQTDKRSQTPRDASIIRKYGAILPVEITLNHALIDQKIHFVAVLHDLTKQNNISRVRREFVSIINQELRAPLTSIHGSLDLIVGGAVGHVNGQIKQLVGVASKNTKRMIRLINDLLDMEKMHSGRLAFNYSSQSVLPLVEQAVESINSYAVEQNVRIVVQEFLNRSEFIKVDVDRMQQVLNYILSNAVKYSPKGSEVRLQIMKEQQTVKISIRDFGPGLPRDMQMRLFQKNEKNNVMSGHIEGAGLSLSMAKMLTEKMGGEIGYDSEEHPGALFYIKLPEWEAVNNREARQVQ